MKLFMGVEIVIYFHYSITALRYNIAVAYTACRLQNSCLLNWLSSVMLIGDILIPQKPGN
eukprot:snap_masked-scaffold_25-processed-gene-4.43-mRNA-1 protein AED:1.00 eAED:1.00 QI:0/-1/0/0/-1/1/1/0/59